MQALKRTATCCIECSNLTSGQLPRAHRWLWIRSAQVRTDTQNI